MASLRCDECGSITNSQGSWDTPIKILCEKCSKKYISEISTVKFNINKTDIYKNEINELDYE